MTHTPVIFHIDVNSAFLSWTSVQRLRDGSGEDLRLVPSIIGGDRAKRHGVVLAKSIPAGRYGIHTGEPVTDAFRKCPMLVTAPPDHMLYSAFSNELMDFLREYSPYLEQLSIDECFQDFTAASVGYSSPEDAADLIRRQIREKFGYTVNVGISSRKVLAKMASDFQKPDRTHTLWPEEIAAKMWPLPVEELYMVGRSAAAVLRKLEINTIGELAHTDIKILELHLKSHGRLLWEYANGIDDRRVVPEQREIKGVGNSTTLPADVTTKDGAAKVLLSLSESVSRRLRRNRLRASMVAVEIRYSDFSNASHQGGLSHATSSSDAIYHKSMELFDELWSGAPIRLLGVRTSRLCSEEEPVQGSLFLSDDEIRRGKLDSALDEIRKKYGENAVRRGVTDE